MNGAAAVCIHATCLELSSGELSIGLLFRGPSGSGKSMLALRLLDEVGTGLASDGVPPVTARLVSDDQVLLRPADSSLLASAPAAISGLIEVRGVGIVQVPCVTAQTRLGLVIDHVPSAAIDRMPPQARAGLCGIDLPLHHLDFARPDTPARVRVLARIAWEQLQLASDSLPQYLAARR